MTTVTTRSAWRTVVRHPALVPVGAVVLAALVGAVVLVASGADPLVAYEAVIRGALSTDTLDYTVSVFAAILGMAMLFAIPLRMGEYNLGGNGQLVAGGVTAAIVALHVPLPGPLLLVGCLLAAALAGGALNAVSAPLSDRLGIPVIISTLLIAPVAVALASYLVRFRITDVGSGVAQTPRLPDAAHLPALGEWRYTNVGLLVVLAALVAFWVVDTRTTAGYEIRALGANRRFARYGGVHLGRLNAAALTAAGAIGGLVGAILVLSPPYRFIDGALTAPGYTFAGVAAALLAGGRPALLPLTVAVFTILQVGGAGMERDADVPRQLSDVLQAVIIIVLALRTVVERRRTERSGA